MTSSLDKATKLLRIKAIRRRQAEARAAAAREAQALAVKTEAMAATMYRGTIDNAASVREKRLEAIFAARDEHPIHQARAVSAYEMTQIEIAEARELWRESRNALTYATERSVAAQQELARFMRGEDKIENLRAQIERQEREAASRRD